MRTEFNLIDDGEDKTRELREYFEPKSGEFILTGRAKTHGMLPEDLEKEYPPYGKIGDIGMGKIILLENKEKFSIKGGELYNPNYAFENEDRPIRRAKTVEELSILEIKNSSYVDIEDMILRGAHNLVREATGYPLFVGFREFSHAVEINGSQYVLLKGLTLSNIPGDGVYFRRGIIRNSFITILDTIIDWNGRQGTAWGDASNVLIDNVTVVKSGRGGHDIEPPTQNYVAENVIIRNSHSDTWLLPFPNGGRGVTRNWLVENNTYKTNSPTTHVNGDWVNNIRENIIFRGNTRIGGFGSRRPSYYFSCANGILIEQETCEISSSRGEIIIQLDDCRNVTIRRNNFRYAKYIVLLDTPIEEVQVYDNAQDLKFIVWSFETPRGIAPYYHDEKYKTARGGYDWEMWREDMKTYDEYLANRVGTFEIVDIPNANRNKEVVPDPNFLPYKADLKNSKEIIDPIDSIMEEPILNEEQSVINRELSIESGENVFENEVNVTKYCLSLIPEGVPVSTNYFTLTPNKMQYMYRKGDRTFNTLYSTELNSISINIVIKEGAIEEPEEQIKMLFKVGDVIINEGVERVVLEVYNGYYIWGYETVEDKGWDSRNSNDPELNEWELKEEPEVEEPETPIETDEEALNMAQKILDFLKKKSSLIAIGIIAVIILLIIIL